VALVYNDENATILVFKHFQTNKKVLCCISPSTPSSFLQVMTKSITMSISLMHLQGVSEFVSGVQIGRY